MRILGIDPGLTRCGIGVIDAGQQRDVHLIHVEVVQSPASMQLAERLALIAAGITAAFDDFTPDRVAIERVFAQQNLRTVMGTAQISGIAIYEANRRGIPVEFHTPSEVKAAVTGNGRADKKQIANMVQRLLAMPDAKMLPDATDALALAICHSWRGSPAADTGGPQTLTPAQQKWRDAERQGNQAAPKP